MDTSRKHIGSIVHSLFPGKVMRSLNKEERSILLREYYIRTKPAHAKAAKKQKDKLYNEFFSHYGYSCVCCGESNKDFLSIEHLNNDGAAHRKRLRARSPQHAIIDIRRAGWPKGYATLCFNCNMGKARMGGTCPHVILKAREWLQEIVTIQKQMDEMDHATIKHA